MRTDNDFSTFMSQLIDTNATLGYYCDFKKITCRIDNVAISLHMLNYLIGQQNMRQAVEALWQRDKSVFNLLDILIAVRKSDKKKYINSLGEPELITTLFTSVDGVMLFLEETGLMSVLQNNQIKDIEDYVFGVEVGLDSNARKNRGGHLMENIVHNLMLNNDIPHDIEITSKRYPELSAVLGTDKKRFDFVVTTRQKTYLIEVNFYSGGGSKLNETARSYSDIAPKINSLDSFEFVWITDGVGWNAARNKLQEAYSIIPKVYNLSNINNFFDILKAEGFGSK